MENVLAISAKQLQVIPITYNQAKQIILKHHYSHTWPGGVSVIYGIVYEKKIYGCICFARGAGINLWKRLGASNSYACCELVRLWLSDLCLKNSESRVISIALRMLFKANPYIEVVGSYADPNHGHVGTIYKASGWEFVGMTTGEQNKIRMADGIIKHKRSISSKYGLLRNLQNISYIKGKKKFLYRYKNKRLPSRTPENHFGVGGAIPTQPLQPL